MIIIIVIIIIILIIIMVIFIAINHGYRNRQLVMTGRGDNIGSVLSTIQKVDLTC